MSDQSTFTPDCKFEPYWWERSPRPELPSEPLPKEVDVAVVGSGYTGLNAALITARAGRSTVVFDAGDAGFGCSSRNGGQIGTSVKPSFAELARKHGESKAFDVIKEGQNALEWIEQFVTAEGIDCDFMVPGRFHAAHSETQFRKLVGQLSHQPKGLEVPYQIVERSDQKQELGTDAYHGGVVFEKHASLDPGLYHKGLLDRVRGTGASTVPNCAVESIESESGKFTVRTQRGLVRARNVIVATNGYTGKLTPWLRRRVIPIGSYMIATDVIAPDVMNRLMPTNRVVSDSRKVVYYYRPSPDRTRILFGGRVSTSETDTRLSGTRLRNDLIKLFPELADVKVSHSWMGTVAYTFDSLAHVGNQDGLYYALGYCGSGVSMASYLGMRVGQQVLGLPEGKTGFDGLKFETRPTYTGYPWFLPASVAWYRWVDRWFS